VVYTIERPERLISAPVINGKRYKPAGGMVFLTRADAVSYLMEVNPLLAASFNIYQVDADWDRDTQQTLDDEPWRILVRSAAFLDEGPKNG
jgi:hypothetical protein